MAFTTFRAACDYVVTILGDQTSLKTLANAAFDYYEPIDTDTVITRPEMTACNARSAWRKQQGTQRDCRQYEGQPRRDMMSDKKIRINTLVKLHGCVAKMGVAASDLRDIVGQFHSISQLVNAIEHIVKSGDDYDLLDI